MDQATPRSPQTPWSRALLAAGALLGLLTVAMGALAAHLPSALLAADGRELLRTAVQMQGWHVPALLACGLLLERRQALALRLSGLAFVAGIACFSTGLTVRAFLGAAGLGGLLAHLAPCGGSVLMLGWLLLAIGGVWPAARR